MDNFGDFVKNFAKGYIEGFKKKFKIVAIIIVVFLVLIVSIAGGGDSVNAEGASDAGVNDGQYVTPANGVSIGTEYLMSWENGSLRQYTQGKISYNDTLKRLVTEDKNYYICYTDYPDNDKGDRNFSYGVCHRPNFGQTYYHVQQYKDVGIVIDTGNYDNVGTSQISVASVDKVFEEIYKTYKEDVKNSFSGTSIEENKLDALTAVKYQYGNIGNAVELYKNNGNFVTEFKVSNGNGGYYYPFNSSNTSYYKGNSARVEANKDLFLNGVYKTGDGSVLQQSQFTGGNLVELAKEIHKYIKDNNYAYSCAENVNNGYSNTCTCNGTSHFGKNNFDEYKDIKCIDCSAYVSWVLNEYLGDSNFNSRWNSAIFGDSSKWLDGWTKVNIEDIQAGDILWRQGHVGIYIGDGKTVEAGCTEAIRRDYSYGSIQTVIADYTYGIRIP